MLSFMTRSTEVSTCTAKYRLHHCCEQHPQESGVLLTPVSDRVGSLTGLYAIAAATSVCYEEFPSGEYDQAAMRGHLRTCIECGVMTHFPSSMRLDLMCNLIIIAIAMILKSTGVSSHQDAFI